MDTFVVSSSAPTDLHDGRMLAPGSEVSLTADEQKESHNATLIEGGRLSPVPEQKKETKAEREAREKAEKAAQNGGGS